MILLAVGLAHAIDAHGPAALADQNGATVWVWQPTVQAPGDVTVGLAGEIATPPLVEFVREGDLQTTRTLLGHLAGSTLGARAGLLARDTALGGLGVSLQGSLPGWLETDVDTSGGNGVLNDAGGGRALGDARLALPVTWAWRGRGYLAAALVPTLTLPTSTADRLLGEDAATFRGRLALTGGLPRLHATVDLTTSATTDLPFATAESGGGLRANVALRARLLDDAEVAVESAHRSTGTGTAHEWLLGASAPFGHGWHLGIAGGGTGGDAPGTSRARGFLRVAWERPRATPKPAAPLAAAARAPEPPAGRTDAVLDVRDPKGRPLDATVNFIAPDGVATPAAQQVGEDGHATLRLAPGRWTIQVAAARHTRVSFSVDILDDAMGPAGLVAVLHPKAGDAELAAHVHDRADEPVDGTSLEVDASVHAQSSIGGDVAISGLAAREVTVTARGEGIATAAEVRVDLRNGIGEADLLVHPPPGAVRVRARDEDGVPVNAQVLAVGPDVRGPLDVGDDGLELVQLAAGTWTLAASAPRYGLQEREVTLVEDDLRVPLVDVVFPALPAGAGELCVRAVDPAGAPVAGLEIRVDEAPVGRTTTGGSACIAGLVDGAHTLTLQSPRIRSLDPRAVTLGAGTQELVIPVRWRPGQLEVHARTTGGLPLDAQVSFRSDQGGEAPAPQSLGADGWGTFELPTGSWTVALTSPSFGVQERTLIVEPGATHLLAVEARLAQEEGAGALLIELLDPDGLAVEGADIRIDGSARGTTTNGGALRVGGLSLGLHRVQVQAARIADIDQQVEVNGADARLRLDGLWKPGTVTLVARGPSGPAADAMVLFTGPELRGPLAVDSTAELKVHLAPGTWSAYGSSVTAGEGERVFPAPTSAPPPVVELALEPIPPPAPTTPADVLVLVRDTDLRPVPSASVSIAGHVQPTGADGVALFEGLPVAPAKLDVTAPGYAPAEAETLALHAGPQQRSVALRGLPRALDVRVRGPEGPVDAQVQLDGRVPMAALRTGDDGFETVKLVPGRWAVAARAEGIGATVQDLEVPAGEGTLAVDLTLGAAQVQVVGTRIDLGAPIRFAFAAAAIEPTSDELLREVAAQLLLHPEFGHVALRGHTDNVGDAAANLLLSRRRADAVRERLVTLGVDATRLSSEGFGDAQPVADNATEAGRAQNRRVEFVVGD